MILLSKKTYFLFIVTLLFCDIASAQNLFDSENSKKFAHYLYSTQQYKLASNEYLRLLNINPNDTTIFSSLLKTYRLGNICDDSFKNLELLNFRNFMYNSSFASEYLKLSITCGYYSNETDFALALSSLNDQEQSFFKLSRFVFQEKRDSLSLFINSDSNILAEYPNVFSKIKDIEHFKPKKPWLASTMSSVIPGSGKAYVGYWGDAVMSLAFVATNAWVSYRGFEKKGVNSASGWIFGSLSVGFYIGNIWGSGKAAKTYNQIEYEKLYHEAKVSITERF